MTADLIGSNDRQILRDLAKKVAELAARPIEEEKRREWTRHNSLKPGRPMIFCSPENAWNEILPHDKALKCEGELARSWEWGLRAQIFTGESLRDDQVIEPCFNVYLTASESNWGVQETKIGGGHGGSYTWDAPLKDLNDLSRLHFPTIAVDRKSTDENLKIAHDTFGGILEVREKSSFWWTLGMTWILVNLRGLEQMMWDMIDNPDGLHKLMAFLRDGTLTKLDYLEQNGLLSLNTGNDYVGSGGFGWSDELPQPGSSSRVRTCDMWGFCESQETVSVSPAMFEEFVFQYQLPILERFGLNCYGCCEPLDSRWHIIKKTPRLRRVSVSPWANIRKMAENLGDNYIFSAKPNPSHLAMSSFDESLIRSTIRRILDTAKGCRVELIMKDTHTICNEPERVIHWVEIAREEIERR